MPDLDSRIVEKDLKINQVATTLQSSKVEPKDMQRRLDGVFSELNGAQSTLNKLRSDFNAALE